MAERNGEGHKCSGLRLYPATGAGRFEPAIVRSRINSLSNSAKAAKMALTMQRYQSCHRISQLRFLDSAHLHPDCEVGRRRIVALRDELLGGPVGEQHLNFRTVLVQLAFARAFRALTMQRYQNGHRIFDTLLKPRRYHRFGGPQFSGIIFACFLGGRTPVVS